MSPVRVMALLVLLSPVVGGAQKAKKQSDVPAAFAQARYVYVRAQDGDVMKPSLYPEDRQAIGDVQNGLRDWNRYAVVIQSDDADLVFIVRKGRSAGGQTRTGISVGSPRQPGQPGQPGQTRQPGQVPDDDNGVGVGAQVGPSEDMLQVFITNHQGRLIGPIWNRAMNDGLEGPDVPLLRDLRVAVERAYPSQLAPKKP